MGPSASDGNVRVHCNSIVCVLEGLFTLFVLEVSVMDSKNSGNCSSACFLTNECRDPRH